MSGMRLSPSGHVYVLHLLFVADLVLTIPLGDKDHQHTKTLLKKSRQSITALVMRYNNLVQEMDQLKRQGRAPRGAKIPAALDTHTLFRLNIDDEIWVEVSFDDGDEEVPLWMLNEGVRASILALLECDCVTEEWECLDAEEKALMTWLKEEVTRIKEARSRAAGTSFLPYH